MKVYAGTSGYSYKEWKGAFYPEKISPGEMLRFYSERLNTVEINNTFYRMPTERVLMSWANQVPGNFVFAFKASQVITHFKRLKDVKEETGYLLRTLSVLGERLGPVLFQFPGSFRADLAALRDFLALIPDTISCAFEFRSATWFDAAVFDLLREKKCSLCIADSDEGPAPGIISTAPWGYLRLRRSDYSDAHVREWAEKIFSQNWERVFVYFKHEGEGEGPEMAVRFKELASRRTRE